MTFAVTPNDLSDFLGVQVDTVRAVTILKYAQLLCESVVTPLPDTALPVIVDIAVRAYQNPGATPAQGAGPFTLGSMPGGIYLTRRNKADLRRLAGGSGAFSIDPLPAAAGTGLPWWDGYWPVSDDES